MVNSCFKKERNMSVLVIFPQTDEAFPQSLDMGWPKFEKQTTSAERMRNHKHVKKVGHTSEFLFGIYWWNLKANY